MMIRWQYTSAVYANCIIGARNWQRSVISGAQLMTAVISRLPGSP